MWEASGLWPTTPHPLSSFSSMAGDLLLAPESSSGEGGSGEPASGEPSSGECKASQNEHRCYSSSCCCCCAVARGCAEPLAFTPKSSLEVALDSGPMPRAFTRPSYLAAFRRHTTGSSAPAALSVGPTTTSGVPSHTSAFNTHAHTTSTSTTPISVSTCTVDGWATAAAFPGTASTTQPIATVIFSPISVTSQSLPYTAFTCYSTFAAPAECAGPRDKRWNGCRDHHCGANCCDLVVLVESASTRKASKAVEGPTRFPQWKRDVCALRRGRGWQGVWQHMLSHSIHVWRDEHKQYVRVTCALHQQRCASRP